MLFLVMLNTLGILKTVGSIRQVNYLNALSNSFKSLSAFFFLINHSLKVKKTARQPDRWQTKNKQMACNKPSSFKTDMMFFDIYAILFVIPFACIITTVNRHRLNIICISYFRDSLKDSLISVIFCSMLQQFHHPSEFLRWYLDVLNQENKNHLFSDRNNL